MKKEEFTSSTDGGSIGDKKNPSVTRTDIDPDKKIIEKPNTKIDKK